MTTQNTNDGFMKLDHTVTPSSLRKLLKEIKKKFNDAFNYHHDLEYFYGWLEDQVYVELVSGEIKSVFRYTNVTKDLLFSYEDYFPHTDKDNYILLTDVLSWEKGYGSKALDKLHYLTKGNDVFLVPYDDDLIEYYEKFDYVKIEESKEHSVCMKKNNI